MRDSFILYGEWERHFALLSPPQQGALAMALFAYNNRGEVYEGDPAVSMAFSFIRAAMDENAAKWEQERAARAEAGRAGGLARAQNTKHKQASPSKSSKAKQTQANQAVSVSVSVSESVSESVPPSEERACHARISIPTLAEVSAYVLERHSPVIPQEFIDFYESKGWLVGKTPMKDWKAACRNAEKWDRWNRPSHAGKAPSPTTGVAGEADQRAKQDMERMIKLMEEGKL